VVVVKKDSDYSVAFALDGVGVWNCRVQADGTVQSEPLKVPAISPPASQLPSGLPGESTRISDTFWLAPGVQASKVFNKTTVTWFNTDWSIKSQRPAEDTGIDTVNAKGIVILTNGCRGINEDWQIIMPRSSASGTFTGCSASTPDSRVFINEFSPSPDHVSLNIYIHGKCVNTIGPFIQHYRSSDVQLNDDGSVALLTWKDESKASAQVIVLNTNGSIRFQTDCGSNVMSPMVAPNGAGVLFRSDSTDRNTFIWFADDGKRQSISLGPNPECLGWAPNTCKSLFFVKPAGRSGHFQLIDWEMGKTLWDIPNPGNERIMALALTPDLILFATPDSPPWQNAATVPEAEKESVRTFYAVRVQDGSLIAQWQAALSQRQLDPRRERFLQLNGKLFYITDAEYTEINLDDIRTKLHGWK
jgi:hypothetical protein